MSISLKYSFLIFYLIVSSYIEIGSRKPDYLSQPPHSYPITLYPLGEIENILLKRALTPHSRSEMSIIRREKKPASTAQTQSCTAKLAVMEDINLSSLRMRNMFPDYRCSVTVTAWIGPRLSAQENRLHMDKCTRGFPSPLLLAQCPTTTSTLIVPCCTTPMEAVHEVNLVPVGKDEVSLIVQANGLHKAFKMTE